MCLLLLATVCGVWGDPGAPDAASLLNQLPMEKLLQLHASLQNITQIPPESNPDHPVAMPLVSPLRRTDIHKSDSKISSVLSLSVTALSFLAFGGYLLCLIIQAVKQKTTESTVFVSSLRKPAGVKGYARGAGGDMGGRVMPPPDDLYEALVRLCEAYASWEKARE